jgi:ketosteroid isomerase-like protein
MTSTESEIRALIETWAAAVREGHLDGVLAGLSTTS